MSENQTTPKIYAFVNGSAGFGRDVVSAAIAADGTVLPASHVSSGPGWARHDMGADGHCTWKHDVYAAHHPDGFDVEWVEDVKAHPVLADLIAKLNAEAAAQVDAAPITEAAE